MNKWVYVPKMMKLVKKVQQVDTVREVRPKKSHVTGGLIQNHFDKGINQTVSIVDPDHFVN